MSALALDALAWVGSGSGARVGGMSGVVEERLQHLRLLAQMGQCVQLNLADAFPRQAELPCYVPGGVLGTCADAVAETEYAGLTGLQSRQRVPHPVDDLALEGGVERLDRRLVREKVFQGGVATPCRRVQRDGASGEQEEPRGFARR